MRTKATDMTNVLEVVRAGAGSGKTTDLCDTVAKAVAAGLDPARILATTFTKKAAAELKGRVQAKLLDESGHTHFETTCPTPRHTLLSRQSSLVFSFRESAYRKAVDDG